MKKESKIIIVVKDGLIAARCRPLGLTAYGDSKREAVEKLKRMFAAYVDAHLRGQL